MMEVGTRISRRLTTKYFFTHKQIAAELRSKKSCCFKIVRHFCRI